jgi:hypothetical protein
VQSMLFRGSDRAGSSCRSFNLPREEILSAPIHSPPLWSPNRSFTLEFFYRRLWMDIHRCGLLLCLDRHIFSSWRWAGTSSRCRPTVSQSSPSSRVAGSGEGLSYNIVTQFVSNRILDRYSTTLLAVPTSCLVASDTFNFFKVCLRATLCGLLGGSGKLTSRLVGCSTNGTCRIPVRLNLEQSWKHYCNISSSSSSDVSSMVMASSFSPTTQRSFIFGSTFH